MVGRRHDEDAGAVGGFDSVGGIFEDHRFIFLDLKLIQRREK